MPSAEAAGTTKKPVRLLCLHGYRTNTEVMEYQSRGLRAALGEDAEFVFLNAPFEATGPTDEALQRMYGADATYYEWGHIRRLDREPTQPVDTIGEKVITYSDNGWYYEYVGFDRVREYIDKKLEELGPFDAVVGFSQGGITATMLSMWYWHHHNTRKWKLCVLFSAPRPRDLNVRSLFENPDQTPIPVPFSSIHVFGQKDTMYDACVEMAGMYADEAMGFKKLVFEHDSGHKFPTPERHVELYEQLAMLIREQCQ